MSFFKKDLCLQLEPVVSECAEKSTDTFLVFVLSWDLMANLYREYQQTYPLDVQTIKLCFSYTAHVLNLAPVDVIDVICIHDVLNSIIIQTLYRLTMLLIPHHT